MLRFDKVIYLSFPLKSILYVRLSNSLMRFRCFTIFRIHKYSIHFCIIPLLNSLYCYTLFLGISFARYREYMIRLILLSNFSDMLPAFTCARAIGSL